MGNYIKAHFAVIESRVVYVTRACLFATSFSQRRTPTRELSEHDVQGIRLDDTPRYSHKSYKYELFSTRIRRLLSLKAWFSNFVGDNSLTKELDGDVHNRRGDENEGRPSFLAGNPHVACLLPNASPTKEEDPCKVEQTVSEAKAKRGVRILSKC